MLYTTYAVEALEIFILTIERVAYSIYTIYLRISFLPFFLYFFEFAYRFFYDVRIQLVVVTFENLSYTRVVDACTIDRDAKSWKKKKNSLHGTLILVDLQTLVRLFSLKSFYCFFFFKLYTKVLFNYLG